MPFGFLVSIACHAALLAWALLTMRAVQPPIAEDTPAISAEVITPSEFLRLKQGSEDAKKLETKAKEEPKPDESKNDTKKPDNAPPPPPPPPQEVAKVEPPPPPEPPKVEPPKPPEPDPIADKLKEPPAPAPPEPAPGPTPDEQKALEQKLEDQRKADEAKKKEEQLKKEKELAEKKEKERKEKERKERERKLAEAKKFDSNKLANLLNKLPDDAEQKALIDKDPRVKGQQAAGTSQTATATGKEAGTATGKDTVLSAREQDLLKGMIKSRLTECWRLPGSGGGTEIPVVKIRWRLDRNGNLEGEPQVTFAPPGEAGGIASETAVRAVKGCQPFALPADKYDAWRDIEWTFDPRQML